MVATVEHARRALSLPDVSPGISPGILRYWWDHARIPLVILLVATIAANTSPLDQSVAHWLFFDATRQRWIGAHNWWTTAFLHDGGRWAVRGIVAASLLLHGSTYVRPRFRALRRPSLYFSIAMILAIGLVGLLKTWTNVDCPWDLREFGGAFPYVHVFAHRPDGLRHAQCFPAAHASSGYALMALYFVAYERSRRYARAGLALGLAMGLIFGVAQQSRGAHFLSHDVWSACITWLVSLTVYAFAFKSRAWESPAPH